MRSSFDRKQFEFSSNMAKEHYRLYGIKDIKSSIRYTAAVYEVEMAWTSRALYRIKIIKKTNEKS